MRRHQRRSQENHKYKTQVRDKLGRFKERASRRQLEGAEAAAGGAGSDTEPGRRRPTGGGAGMADGLVLWLLTRGHSVGASLEKEGQVVVLLFFQELH